MKNLYLPFLGLCLSAYAVNAQTPAITQLDEIVVETDQAMPACSHSQSGSELKAAPLKHNTAQGITAMPGVSAVHQNADYAEPVIRGLGWERVATQVDNLPLYGSCPSRMDPPAACIAAIGVQQVEVIKGLPSVTLGSGGTAGRVRIDTKVDPNNLSADDPKAGFDVTWNEGRDGVSTDLFTKLGTNRFAIRAALNFQDQGDYESGDGKTVPAENQSYGAAVSTGYRTENNNLLYGSWNLHQVDHVDYPALPMNTVDSTANTFTSGFIAEELSGKMKKIDLSLGYSDVDHTMDNSGKANRGKMHASTDSTAETLGARIATDWEVSSESMLTLGFDYQNLQRDALRTRKMTATGMTLKDRLWPEAEQETSGLFAEWELALAETTQLRLGARVDSVSSEASKANSPLQIGPAGMGKTIRDGYIKYYGAAAGDTDQDETLASANMVLEWAPKESTSFFAGIGLTSRAAGITERYFSFAPAPGGYLVGNPDLDAEQKYELNLGSTVQSENTTVEVSAFYAQVDDYIYQHVIDRIDLNGDGKPDTIRGFDNVDAELYGAELSGVHMLSDSFSVPFVLAYVRGKNTTDDRDLPEMPPLNGSLALRFDKTADTPWWAEAGLRFASKQSDIDDLGFGEESTAGYEVFDLRAGIEINANLSLEVGVENVFDENYYDHLSRETIMPEGDLKAGEKVPQIGRFFYVSLSCRI